jgi:hypothetical protein
MFIEKRTSLLRTYRAGEADHGRQAPLRRGEPVGVLFDGVGAGVGVDHGVSGGVQDDADVPGGGRGAVGSSEEDQVAGLDLAGGDLGAVGPLGCGGAGMTIPAAR